MKTFALFGFALLLIVSSSLKAGEKLVSGPQVGSDVPGAFYPKNITGPFAGDKHCLYCEFGGSPVAMIFARTVSPELGKLLKEVDAVTARHQNLNMGSCVIFLNAKEDLEKELLQLARKEKLKNIILSIDHPAGPLDYKIAGKADLTVLLYDNATVQFNHTFRSGQLNDQAAAAILADLKKMVKE